MSQDQPRRAHNQQQHGDSIKYGDVVRDASMMQAAEDVVLGQTHTGGPAATMQSVATQNVRARAFNHDPSTGVSQEMGVTITETFVPGGRIITEFVAGQVVDQYVSPGPGDAGNTGPSRSNMRGGNNQCGGHAGSENMDPTKITIGEVLEAVGRGGHDKPVKVSDAEAIQVAEAQAIGLNVTMPGGVAAQAQSAADENLLATRDEDKATLADVLSDAAERLPVDKPVERDDAARVVGAEIRNKEDAKTAPCGVAATMAAAARLNERST